MGRWPRAVTPPTEAAKGFRAKLDHYLAETQNPDGSWTTNGRPPMLESPEIATLMTILTLGGDERSEAARGRAREWLAKKPVGSLQGRALRLLDAVRSGKAEASEIEALRKAQNEDGGWSQTPAMASDAYATGLVLYVLAEAGQTGPEIGKAQAFLVRTQAEDGSWGMTSRPAKEGDKPAKNLRPITYAGSAWATLGLIRSYSQK